MHVVSDKLNAAYAKWAMEPDAMKTKERVVRDLREIARNIERGSCLEMFDEGWRLRKLSTTVIDLGALWHQCFPQKGMPQ